MDEYRSFRKKHFYNLLTTRRDAADFSAALRAAFPAIKFLREEYWEQFVDWNSWRQRVAEAHARRARGEDVPRVSYQSRDPEGEPLEYYESMADPRERHFRAWIEPRDWKPFWTPFGDGDQYHIVNEPEMDLQYSRQSFVCEDRDETEERAFDDPPQRKSDDESIRLRWGSLYSGYYADNAEDKAFVHKVFRIAKKLTTNVLINVDKPTRRPMFLEGRPRGVNVVAGLHAAAWSLEHRHNYLDFYTKAPGFPYDPAEVLPEDEWDFTKKEKAYAAKLAAQPLPATNPRQHRS